jgi:predicted DNA binding CopG/RHH family protein
MPQRLKPVPKFANEAEEREFWESHDTTQYVDWSRAKLASFPNLRPSTKTISLRLPEDVLDSIRVHARKLDVPYQSLMKLWLAEKAAQVRRPAQSTSKLRRLRS